LNKKGEGNQTILAFPIHTKLEMYATLFAIQQQTKEDIEIPFSYQNTKVISQRGIETQTIQTGNLTVRVSQYHTSKLPKQLSLISKVCNCSL
jgi:hypothetical protein